MDVMFWLILSWAYPKPITIEQQFSTMDQCISQGQKIVKAAKAQPDVFICKSKGT